MLKKILSSILLCALLVPTLASCGKRVEKRMAKAEEYITSNPYAVRVSVDFTADEGVSAIFDEISSNKKWLISEAQITMRKTSLL